MTRRLLAVLCVVLLVSCGTAPTPTAPSDPVRADEQAKQAMDEIERVFAPLHPVPNTPQYRKIHDARLAVLEQLAIQAELQKFVRACKLLLNAHSEPKGELEHAAWLRAVNQYNDFEDEVVKRLPPVSRRIVREDDSW